MNLFKTFCIIKILLLSILSQANSDDFKSKLYKSIENKNAVKECAITSVVSVNHFPAMENFGLKESILDIGFVVNSKHFIEFGELLSSGGRYGIVIQSNNVPNIQNAANQLFEKNIISENQLDQAFTFSNSLPKYMVQTEGSGLKISAIYSVKNRKMTKICGEWKK